MELGKRLQECRESKRVTQAEMAAVCGLSKNYISAMERGVNKCNAQTLIAYADRLGMSLDEIVDDKSDYLPGQQSEHLSDGKKGGVIPELQQAIEGLAVERQRKVLQMIRIMF